LTYSVAARTILSRATTARQIDTIPSDITSLTFYPVYGEYDRLGLLNSAISDGQFCYSIVNVSLNYTVGSMKEALSITIFQE
jgi:hypothetical protein